MSGLLGGYSDSSGGWGVFLGLLGLVFYGYILVFPLVVLPLSLIMAHFFGNRKNWKLYVIASYIPSLFLGCFCGWLIFHGLTSLEYNAPFENSICYACSSSVMLKLLFGETNGVFMPVLLVYVPALALLLFISERLFIYKNWIKRKHARYEIVLTTITLSAVLNPLLLGLTIAVLIIT